MKKRIFIVAGLGYGDESKGSIVDWLSSVYPVKEIWRYNGGSQAAHNVVLEDGVNHCFAQFGSGLLEAPVLTGLSRFMAINPINLMNEYEILEKKLKFKMPPIYIDSQSPVITPYHVLTNQIRELSRGLDRRGTCGYGVGETFKDAEKYPRQILRIGDLNDINILKSKLKFWRALKIDEAEQLAGSSPTCLFWLGRIGVKLDSYFDFLLNFYSGFLGENNIHSFDNNFSFPEVCGDVVYEGAQGVLLHRDYGFFPHVTQSDTSFQNAEKLIAERKLEGEVFKIGVLRAYWTRHGAGPFVTEDESLKDIIPEEHNKENEWQGDFRLGWFDLVAARYALKIIGSVDGLALTNLDRLLNFKEIKVCVAYRYQGRYPQLVAKYFICEPVASDNSVLITGIKKPLINPRNFMRQITCFLNSCEPVYETIKVTSDFFNQYPKYLEEKLGVKIVLISTGPKASDKKVIGRLPLP